jgi:hypothetical protein
MGQLVHVTGDDDVFSVMVSARSAEGGSEKQITAFCTLQCSLLSYYSSQIPRIVTVRRLPSVDTSMRPQAVRTANLEVEAQCAVIDLRIRLRV